MSYLENYILELSSRYAVKNINGASEYAFNELSRYCQCKKSDNNLSFYGKLEGESDYTLMLDAHIDEVAFIVTDVDDNGFLTVSNCGGIDTRTLLGKKVLIHGKENISGVFISTPPHLGGNNSFDDISKIKIDTCLGNKAKDVISLGDIVTYDVKPLKLLSKRITGKSLDDRVGVAVLIELARRLKEKKLPINVVFSVVDGEELGMRGAIPATFSISPDEAVAVDVTFGIAPDVTEKDGGYLGKGAMIGVSPVLNSDVTNKLNQVAFDNNIPYQNEVMGRTTGTDSDVISSSGNGVKTGLISIPLRNMHTDCEIIDLADVESTCDILEKYILLGGIYNA